MDRSLRFCLEGSFPEMCPLHGYNCHVLYRSLSDLPFLTVLSWRRAPEAGAEGQGNSRLYWRAHFLTHRSLSQASSAGPSWQQTALVAGFSFPLGDICTSLGFWPLSLIFGLLAFSGVWPSDKWGYSELTAIGADFLRLLWPKGPCWFHFALPGGSQHSGSHSQQAASGGMGHGPHTCKDL